MLRILSEKLKFDPSEMFKDRWTDEVRDAQDKAKIKFDLENDDSVSEIKRLTFPNNAPTDSPQPEDVYYVQLCSG